MGVWSRFKMADYEFRERVEVVLMGFATWNRIQIHLVHSKGMEDDVVEQAWKELMTSLNGTILNQIKPLIYFFDVQLYYRIWKKKPSKTCLKRGIDTLYEFE